MATETVKPVRCAIYTRKSTDHGLEQEFNSLDAQREACEAYIKSQAFQGWRPLPRHYDDPAYSGGNLDRPALRQLLADIEAGHIDVVVVYKIDRLTRSLADFAKLVELFDAKSISFVAVTQQFNTTTSMGRLTLNVLLSFAQFERELSSERVRDKVAASRRKGKWTGGGIPLGYDPKDKKLVVNEAEAKLVRTIFRRYLDVGTLQALAEDLGSKGFVSKLRVIKGRKSGGREFTHGPLAHLLKNRTYLGKIGHGGKWFPGEHEPIIDQELFDRVQSLLKSNTIERHRRRSQNGALLGGLLYDDRRNRMTPSFSTKKGVRYHFYVSLALLKGRKQEAGSLSRVSAPNLEAAVMQAVRKQMSHHESDGPTPDRQLIETYVERIEISRTKVEISLKDRQGGSSSTRDGDSPVSHAGAISLPWSVAPQGPFARVEGADNKTDNQNAALVQAVTRAHMWLRALTEGAYDSIEELAAAVDLHPKVVRKSIRLAFLAPDITEAILKGEQSTSQLVALLQETLPLEWEKQREFLGFSAAIQCAELLHRLESPKVDYSSDAGRDA